MFITTLFDLLDIQLLVETRNKHETRSQKMKKMLNSLLFLSLLGCSDLFLPYEPVEGEPHSWELELTVEPDPRLDLDDNGYYHLTLDRNNWQTLHRLSGHVYRGGEPLEVQKINWRSSHYWFIGDTLGYVVSIGLTDDLEYVSYDTSYVTWFNGWEVPTVNCCSYSNADGEVNTMFAPVQSMEGDTVMITMYWYHITELDFSDFGRRDESFYIVLD